VFKTEEKGRYYAHGAYITRRRERDLIVESDDDIAGIKREK
jgi:hypothetical protein